MEALNLAYRGVTASDEVIAKVLKVDEVARIARTERRLREYLLASWKRSAAKATKAGVAAMRAGRGVRGTTAAVRREMGKWPRSVEETVGKEVDRMYHLARIAGWRKGTKQTSSKLTYDMPKLVQKADPAYGFPVAPAFDIVDEEAVAAMQEQMGLWVGDHYADNVSMAIQDAVREETIRAGNKASVAADALRGRLAAELGMVVTPGGFTGTAAQYFEGLAANAATVARVYGQIESFARIGITTYTVWNPLDERTCPSCGLMNGKQFTVKQAQEQISRELAATSKDAYKKAHPWYTDKQYAKMTSNGHVSKDDSEALAKAGAALPPYHFKCRCTVDVSEDAASWEALDRR
jgi:hypothetical protein